MVDHRFVASLAPLSERPLKFSSFKGIIAYTNNHMPNTDDPLALFDKIYDKPWTRLGPYLVGMSVGYILFKTNCKIKFTRVSAPNLFRDFLNY